MGDDGRRCVAAGFGVVWRRWAALRGDDGLMLFGVVE
jgi:hypothetical protein